MHVNERFKNKNKIRSRHIQIDDLVHKKCNRFMKGWRHCLTSHSKKRLLVNNHSSDSHPPTPFPLVSFLKREINYILRRGGGEFEKLRRCCGRWKYGAGAGLLKRRGWHFSYLIFTRFIIFRFSNNFVLSR